MDCKSNTTEAGCKASGCTWVNAKKPFCRKPPGAKKSVVVSSAPVALPPPPPPMPLVPAPVALPPPPPPSPPSLCNKKDTKYVKNPSLYICNPETHKWVLKSSAKGKQLLAAAAAAVAVAAVPPPPPPVAPVPSPSICNKKSKAYLKNPDAFVCNPTTKHWVLKTSALGKKLLKGYIPKKKVYKAYLPYAPPPPPPPPPPPQPIFSPVKMTDKLKAFMTKKMIEFKNSIKKPRMPFFTNTIQFYVEKYHKNTGWKGIQLEIPQFPYKFLKASDFPYRSDGSVDRAKWNRLAVNDLSGISNNAPWFLEQVEYIKSLPAPDRDLIYDYTLSPSKIDTLGKIARLQQIIVNAPPLHATITVWRGVTHNYITMDENKLYTNKNRFISTSIVSSVAIDRFMGAQCCLFKIVVQKGARCLFLASSQYQTEHEILLHKDSLFKVLKERIRVLNIPNKPFAQMNYMLYLA